MRDLLWSLAWALFLPVSILLLSIGVGVMAFFFGLFLDLKDNRRDP